jgi:hypothetical protein
MYQENETSGKFNFIISMGIIATLVSLFVLSFFLDSKEPVYVLKSIKNDAKMEITWRTDLSVGDIVSSRSNVFEVVEVK